MDVKPITFYATVTKVQTLADGGLRLTLDLGEDAIMPAAELMACKRAGVVLDVVCNEKSRDDDGEQRKDTRSHF